MRSYEDLLAAWNAGGRQRVHRPTLTLTRAGLELGARTVIVRSGRDCWRRRCLEIEGDEARILALLSVAYWRELPDTLIGALKAAGRAFTTGDLSRAYIIIAQTGLEALPDEGAAACRLFMAERLLTDGMDEDELLAGLGLAIPWSRPEPAAAPRRAAG